MNTSRLYLLAIAALLLLTFTGRRDSETNPDYRCYASNSAECSR